MDKTYCEDAGGEVLDNGSSKGISVVVPVFNEAENIVALHKEILEACVKLNRPFEIIFIDDGSSDDTFKIAKELSPLRYIRFRKNFGQTAAMDAGIKVAKLDYIVTMDGDRQNDPQDIELLIQHLENNDLDVVSGWRKNRKDTFMKKFASRGANLLRHFIVKDDIHDSGCSLKIYRRECFENLHLYGEMHRFIPAMLKIKGFTVGEIVVNHRPRTAGVTKYNWKRTFKGFVDMISIWFWNKFAVRPLHLLGSIGIISFMFGAIFSLWTLILFIMGEDLSDNFQPILTVVFLGSGVLLFILGLMSDILSKIYYGNNLGTSYSVKEYFDTDEVKKY